MVCYVGLLGLAVRCFVTFAFTLRPPRNVSNAIEADLEEFSSCNMPSVIA